jgi:VanZ family protein
MRASPLARILFAFYVLLTVYATLYPLRGWRMHGASPFSYLGAPWPTYITATDLTLNVLGYLPFGLLGVLALHPRVRGLAAFVLVVLAAFALSASLEAAQTYLPMRIASNVDVITNVSGALAGAVLALFIAPRLLGEGPLKRLRAGAFLPGAGIDLGIAVLGLWLFSQLHPTPLLFGNGELRQLLPPEGRAHAPELFVTLEAITAAASIVAVALLASALGTPRQPARWVLLVLIAAALAVKTLAFGVLLRAEDVFAWLTRGAQQGVVAGTLLALLAVSLPRTARLALAAMLLMAATVLVNLAPPNPYFVAAYKLLRREHFLNFYGLTSLVSAAWPFLALGYLIFLAGRREPAWRTPLG